MLLRQTLLYLPAQVLGPLFQFIAAIVWTHYLTPSQMGVFALIVAAQELVQLVTLFWFNLYTVRYYHPGGAADEQEKFLNTESAVLLLASLGAAGFVLPMMLLIEADWSPSLVVAAIAYALTRGVAAQLSDRARAGHETLAYSALQISWPVLGLLIGLVLVEVMGPGVAAVLLGYALAQGLSLIYAFSRLGYGRLPSSGSREAILQALAFGVPLVVGAMLIWVANNGIRFIVEHYESAEAVGLLTVGWALGLRGAAMASMLTTAAAFPVAMTRARDEGTMAGQAQLERNGVLLLFLLAPVTAGLWAIAEPMVSVLVAAPFHQATIAILPFALFAGAVRSVRIHFGEQVFLLHERPAVPLWNDLLDATASMIGSLIGLTWYGLAGAAAGSAAGAALSLFVTLGFARRIYAFGLPMRDALRIGAATFVMALVVTWMDVPASVGGLVVTIVTGAGIYALAAALFYPHLVGQLFGHIRDLSGKE